MVDLEILGLVESLWKQSRGVAARCPGRLNPRVELDAILARQARERGAAHLRLGGKRESRVVRLRNQLYGGPVERQR